MKGSREIYLDYRRAKQAAERLECIADDLNRYGRGAMPSILEDLSEAWRCSASSNFRAKGERLGESAGRTSQKLRQTAENIRRDAWRIYQAEMRALEIATRRDS